MIIAHISDLHLGPQFLPASFKQAVKEIKKLEPDVVVASGDFTENGLLAEYRAAARELKELDDYPMITIPGNHDYRSTGYLIYKELFGEKQSTIIGNVIFLAVSTARPDRDEGEVGHRQNVWLEESLKKNKDKTKIVVMHHHVVQVPDTGTDRITIVDAGDVLKSLLSEGADIVLCGHRHRPWMWKLNDLLIAHAGTVSSERTRGFFASTYNIVEVNEKNGSSKVWLKIVGGKKLALSDVVRQKKAYIPDLTST